MDWGPGAQGGFQNSLAMGMQLGGMVRQRQDEKDLRNALAQFDPLKPETLQPVMAVRPDVGMQLRGQMAAAQSQAAKDRRADLPMLTNLLETATDEGTYQRNMQVAQQYGIDTSTLPQQFDPAWRDQQLMTMKALQTPQGQEALSNAGKIAVDRGYKPGTPEFNQAVTSIWTAEQSKTIPYQPGGNVIEYNASTGVSRPLVQGAGQAMPQQMAPQPQRPPAAPQPRPEGLTDEQLFQMGRKAVDDGAPIEEVFQRLKAWGVKVT